MTENRTFIHQTLNKNSIVYRSNYVQEFITRNINGYILGALFKKKINLNNINCIISSLQIGRGRVLN